MEIGSFPKLKKLDVETFLRFLSSATHRPFSVLFTSSCLLPFTVRSQRRETNFSGVFAFSAFSFDRKLSPSGSESFHRAISDLQYWPQASLVKSTRKSLSCHFFSPFSTTPPRCAGQSPLVLRIRLTRFWRLRSSNISIFGLLTSSEAHPRPFQLHWTALRAFLHLHILALPPFGPLFCFISPAFCLSWPHFLLSGCQTC